MNTLKTKTESCSSTFSEILSEYRASLFKSPSPSKEALDELKEHAGKIDNYFQGCFESSSIGPQMDFIKNPYAIIALGGYGRSEQCVHSDVDLLFLFLFQLFEAPFHPFPDQCHDLFHLQILNCFRRDLVQYPDADRGIPLQYP